MTEYKQFTEGHMLQNFNWIKERVIDTDVVKTKQFIIVK